MLDLKAVGLEIADLCQRSSFCVDEFYAFVQSKGRDFTSYHKLVFEDYFQVSIADADLSVDDLMGGKFVEQAQLQNDLVKSGLRLSNMALKLYEHYCGVYEARLHSSREYIGDLSSSFSFSAHDERQSDVSSFLYSITRFQDLAYARLHYLIDGEDCEGLSDDMIEGVCNNARAVIDVQAKFCEELSNFIELHMVQQKSVLAGAVLMSTQGDIVDEACDLLNEFDRHAREMADLFLTGYAIVHDFPVVNQSYEVVPYIEMRSHTAH